MKLSFLNINVLFLLLIFTPYITAYAETPPELSSDQERLREECQDIFSEIFFINIPISVIEEYGIVKQGELKFNYKAVFLNLKRTYMLASNNICNGNRMFATDVEDDSYLCIINKISNSLRHLRNINEIIGNIHSADDAMASSSLIQEMLTYYFENFFIYLESPCETPPLPLFKAKIEGYSKELIDIIVSRLDDLLINFPYPPSKKFVIKFEEKKTINIDKFDKKKYRRLSLI